MGLYSFTLPHTPPKGAEAGGDVLGLGALKLFREPHFLVFAICALLISIPLSFYFFWFNNFLSERSWNAPTAWMTLGQVTEIAVMFTLPWFITRFGLKSILTIGMAAWAVRYMLFGTLNDPLILLGIVVHGFCYVFVFVAAFIYANRSAPREMSASAQSLVAFLTWGAGMFIGTKLAGIAGDRYVLQGQMHHWPPIWLWPAGLAALVAVVFLIAGRDVKGEEAARPVEDEPIEPLTAPAPDEPLERSV
jgi:MFS family permease